LNHIISTRLKIDSMVSKCVLYNKHHGIICMRAINQGAAAAFSIAVAAVIKYIRIFYQTLHLQKKFYWLKNKLLNFLRKIV
jgi:hypothetical protein